MKKLYLGTYFFFLSLCLTGLASSLWAQQSVFIPNGGQVFAHPADSIGIFGNMTNNGSLGSQKGAVINFMGTTWNNSTLSTLPGTGGLYRFRGSQQQRLEAGYNFNAKSGPSFPNISIENPGGIQLQDLNDLHVRGNLHFIKGSLFLNGWNALIDDSITGFSDQNFVITGSAIGGGSLYRAPPPVSDSLIVFPIGTSSQSYSPMSIEADQIFSGVVGANVFDHVYLHATSGNKIDSNFVKKTWQVKSVQDNGLTRVKLQHDDADEGALFSHYRDSSYVSLYQRADGFWDVDSLEHHVIHPGDLTTGTLRNFDYLNDRTFPEGIPNESPDSISWLSISTAEFSDNTCPVADFKMWKAQRYNSGWVQFFWRTNFEQNVLNYEVQRRLDSSSTYQTVATIDGQGHHGFSDQLQYYYAKDNEPYDGWIYYRLKLTSKSGCVAFTDEQSIAWDIDIQVWPNPSTDGNVHIKVEGVKHPIKMQLVDTWGQILGHYELNNDQMIDVTGLADAVYFLVFRDPKRSNRMIKTVKLVVIHGD